MVNYACHPTTLAWQNTLISPDFPGAMRQAVERDTGDAVWLAVPAEHYQHLQTELRRRFPRTPIVVTTLVNGWAPGYLPTADTYGRGVYQELIAMVASGGLEKLIEEVAKRMGKWLS